MLLLIKAQTFQATKKKSNLITDCTALLLVDLEKIKYLKIGLAIKTSLAIFTI